MEKFYMWIQSDKHITSQKKSKKQVLKEVAQKNTNRTLALKVCCKLTPKDYFTETLHIVIFKKERKCTGLNQKKKKLGHRNQV